MLNVKALIPVTLDLATGNYARCRGLFLVVLGKYALTDHVLYDAPLPNHADWAQMDCVVLGWRTISHDLLQEVMSPTATTRSIWHDLEFQILENCELRAINLSTEFHGFTQGDISIFEYCRRLNTMADNLADLGEPQSDRMLINGLSTKYGNTTTSARTGNNSQGGGGSGGNSHNRRRKRGGGNGGNSRGGGRQHVT
ncbi:uncharacterized protein [Oryza sativa Japonica Group]|uniref:uncharacterized protein n=1 Tax=Oryza sativa subsp. japonica TaxID=39947 RepID=UPI00339C9339